MSALQIAMLAGAMVGLGVVVILAQVLPAHVDSKWAIQHLDPVRTPRTAQQATPRVSGTQDKVGLFLQRRAPRSVLSRVPVKELAILRRPLHHYLGEKGLLALIGLAFPPAATILFSYLGARPPFAFPVFASIGLAVFFWFAPDLKIKGEAKEARVDFTRALASYVDLVALERKSGSGTHDSLRNAAKVGDSWVFARIVEELEQAELSGEMPWDALKHLGDEFDVTELNDVAEIMRISRQESASVYSQLRAKATSIRNAQMSEELAKANSAAEQLTMPLAALAMVFLSILIAPALLTIL